MHPLFSIHFFAKASLELHLIHVSTQSDDYCCTTLPPRQYVICNLMDMLYAFLSSMTIWVDHLEFNKEWWNDTHSFSFMFYTFDCNKGQKARFFYSGLRPPPSNRYILPVDNASLIFISSFRQFLTDFSSNPCFDAIRRLLSHKFASSTIRNL